MGRWRCGVSRVSQYTVTMEKKVVKKQSAPRSKPKERITIPVRMLEIVFPNQTNHLNTMFGGEVVALADKAAFFAANKFCRHTVVTASMERIDFRHPIKSGDTVEIGARVVFTGRTSMVVKFEIEVENPVREVSTLCATGYITMIALDEHGAPIEVPQLKLRSQRDRDEWEEARKIRKMHTAAS